MIITYIFAYIRHGIDPWFRTHANALRQLQLSLHFKLMCKSAVRCVPNAMDNRLSTATWSLMIGHTPSDKIPGVCPVCRQSWYTFLYVFRLDYGTVACTLTGSLWKCEWQEYVVTALDQTVWIWLLLRLRLNRFPEHLIPNANLLNNGVFYKEVQVLNTLWYSI